MNRFRVAWRVLRGHAVMHRVALSLDPERGRLYVTGRGSAPLDLNEVRARAALVGTGEVVVIDWNTELIYARQVDGTTP